jgi:4-azaleucine resistance transporter AzlC
MISINTTGVEFSMTALFVVILTENLLKPESRLSALVGLGVSLVCLLLFGSENFLIPAMIGIAAALLALRPVLGPKNMPNKNAPDEEAEKEANV